eukprot:scaffold256790_cov30-Tisochrysis_lutea.AAC.2
MGSHVMGKRAQHEIHRTQQKHHIIHTHAVRAGGVGLAMAERRENFTSIHTTEPFCVRGYTFTISQMAGIEHIPQATGPSPRRLDVHIGFR